MKRGTKRILTTHAGSLPQPDDLKAMVNAKNKGGPYDQEAFAKRVRAVIAEVVKKQLHCGIDIVNDGEVGKPNFSRYARDRLSGFVERPAKPGERPSMIFGRDLIDFPEYFQQRFGTVRGENTMRVFCNGPLKYTTDIVEHPEVIADRLVRYAKLVGRENVMAGTDCGLGPRVGHPKIAWAKFEAMAEGARLWG